MCKELQCQHVNNLLIFVRVAQGSADVAKLDTEAIAVQNAVQNKAFLNYPSSRVRGLFSLSQQLTLLPAHLLVYIIVHSTLLSFKQYYQRGIRLVPN